MNEKVAIKWTAIFEGHWKRLKWINERKYCHKMSRMYLRDIWRDKVDKLIKVLPKNNNIILRHYETLKQLNEREWAELLRETERLKKKLQNDRIIKVNREIVLIKTLKTWVLNIEINRKQTLVLKFAQK